jgi:hypothetical protein
MEVSGTRRSRRTARAVSQIEDRTLLRVALVRAEALVASEEMHEIDFLGWEAMTGHAFLATRCNHLAGEDIILGDELRVFKDTARLAKAEIMVAVVNRYQRM